MCHKPHGIAMRVPCRRHGILPSSACYMPPPKPLCLLFVDIFVLFFSCCFALVVSLTSNSYFASIVAVGGGLFVFSWNCCFMLCVTRTLAFANPPRAVRAVLSVDIEHTTFIAGIDCSSYCARAKALKSQSRTRSWRLFVLQHVDRGTTSLIRMSSAELYRFHTKHNTMNSN